MFSGKETLFELDIHYIFYMGSYWSEVNTFLLYLHFVYMHSNRSKLTLRKHHSNRNPELSSCSVLYVNLFRSRTWCVRWTLFFSFYYYLHFVYMHSNTDTQMVHIIYMRTIQQVRNRLSVKDIMCIGVLHIHITINFIYIFL
jgi:hypothetical protein